MDGRFANASKLESNGWQAKRPRYPAAGANAVRHRPRSVVPPAPDSTWSSRRDCAIACWGERVLARQLEQLPTAPFSTSVKITQQIEVQNGDVLGVGDLSFSFQISLVESEPQQELRKDPVLWLMGESDDSEVLDPGVATAMIEISSMDFDQEPPTEPLISKSKAEGEQESLRREVPERLSRLLIHEEHEASVRVVRGSNLTDLRFVPQADHASVACWELWRNLANAIQLCRRSR